MGISLGAAVAISDVVAVARRRERVSFEPSVDVALAASRAVVDAVLAEGKPVYGLNTELGAGRDIVVSGEKLEAFQRRIIRNSSGGIGDPLSDEQARAVIFARLAGFTRGGSGVRPALAEQYKELLNRDAAVLIPRTGSVGAADLTHLAAVAAVASGTGRGFLGVQNGPGHTAPSVPGAEVLAAIGLEPITLAPHEGLASLSGNSYSVGVGALVVNDLEVTAVAADRVLALSISALGSSTSGGNVSPFTAVVSAAHPAEGQSESAHRLRALLGDGAGASTQDPVSFRAGAQVHGAFVESVATAADAVELELNSRTENPLVDIATGTMVSNGNFQVLGLALSFESLRLALGHVAATSERRLARLSTLTAAARRDGSARVPGLLWYSSAALVSEVRQLANPVTLLAPSLSEDVEDHSSNAAVALQLLERSQQLTRTVLAIEAITAAELVLLAADGARIARTTVTAPLRSIVEVVAAQLDADATADELVTAVEAELFG